MVDPKCRTSIRVQLFTLFMRTVQTLNFAHIQYPYTSQNINTEIISIPLFFSMVSHKKSKISKYLPEKAIKFLTNLLRI